MALAKRWAGRAYGTNTGNLFVKLDGADDALVGTLRFNEPGVGIVVYDVVGSFDGTQLALTGEPNRQIDGLEIGQLKVAATLNPKGDLDGEWETDIGSAGTFGLYPHDQTQVVDFDEDPPDQLYTARHRFGAIEIDREQIIALADGIQRDFKKGQVVVTVDTGTEQSHYLENFKSLNFNAKRAAVIKVIGREPEGGETSKVVSVEFGPQINSVMTQGASEAWVLGKREKLKRDLRRFERVYTTNFKRWGFGFNQFLIAAAIVFLPSLASLGDRAIFAAGILTLIFAVNWFHSRHLPLAAIYLGKKPKGLLRGAAPVVISWLVTATASIAAALLAAYLQGWLELPPAR